MTANSTMEFMKDFLMGGISAAIAKTATAPIERVKLILQLQHIMEDLPPEKKYKGPVDCFFRVSREEGVISLWRGNLANIIRYFPTQAFNFAFKEQYKNLIAKFLGKPDPKKEFGKFFMSNLLSGGLAGTTSLMLVYPLDFARTRLATDMKTTNSERQFNGLMDCLQKIVKSDGVNGLYRGFVISAVGIFFYRAAYFGLYDSSKEFTGKDANLAVKFIVAQIVVTLSGLISYPLDTVRRRLMKQSGKKGAEVNYTGTIDAFNKILAKEGPRGFFKGAFTNAIRGVGASLVLVLYDEIKKIFDPNAKPSSE